MDGRKKMLSNAINMKLKVLTTAMPMIAEKFKQACKSDAKLNRLTDEAKKEALEALYITLKLELDKPDCIISKLPENYVYRKEKQTDTDKAFDFYINAIFHKGVAFFHYS